MEQGRPTWDRYRQVVRDESELLAATSTGLLDAPVPSCPGWDVADLVRHVAGVFRHKTIALRTGAEPETDDDGIPAVDADPVADLRLAAADLDDALGSVDPAATGWTWASVDQTHGFWFRRMTHEVVVHRLDAQLARCAATGQDCVTAVDTDIALDGVDEFLEMFVGGDWAAEGVVPENPVDASVRLTADGRSWTLGVDTDRLDVRPGADGDVDAEVAGSAADLLAWVWGRVPADALSVSGDDAAAAALQRRFAEASS